MSTLQPSAEQDAMAEQYIDGELVQVQITRLDNGEMLCCQWYTPNSYTDLREQFTALFGAPMVEGTLNAEATGEVVSEMMARPDTHVIWGSG